MLSIKAAYRRIGKLAAHQLQRLKYHAAIRGHAANARSIANRLKVTYQPVTCPVVLISQAERSGGSMLAQLFDSHSKLLAHPHELKIGYPNKIHWPQINLNGSVDENFRVLFEHDAITMCERGYAKGKYSVSRKNFFFLPRGQREVFRAMSNDKKNSTSRDVLNAYFTSYFNAWINMQGDIETAKFVTGFTPRLADSSENMDQFWYTYPDGYLISIVRSPLSWYPSIARQKAGKRAFSTKELTADHWNNAVNAMFHEKQRKPEQVIVISFDDLVTKTESTMRLICRRIGIDYEGTLVVPTFNGKPIEANTSFDPMTPGSVSSAPTKRESFLASEERAYITKACMPLHERAMRELIEKV